ncbi:MAG: hypothetical protein FWG91_05015 [Lachnospiraceae bacterium]|nr:hypothetical protein [Lachnospiraceae bacterium]
MEKNKFEAILPIVIGGLLNKIIEETNISADEAFEKLYNSELYEALENEKMKLWTYSVPKLYTIYNDEITKGKLELLG